MTNDLSLQSRFYEQNLGTDKTLQDNLDYAKGEAAGVGEVAGNVLTGLAYAIENPMEAGEAISASTLKLVADPATTLGDIKDRREDATINARLDALQGDHYSAGRTQTASDLELGLEIAGMVPVPAGKVAKLELPSNGSSAQRGAGKSLLNGKYARRDEVSFRPAEEVNSSFPDGWQPPYKPGTRVTEFTTNVDDVYVRVHGDSNRARAWMMKREAIEGLTPEEIQSKYALPDVPTHMSEVHVPEGTRVRSGTVNPVFEGVGNAIQYELLQRLPESAFKNTVRIEK